MLGTPEIVIIVLAIVLIIWGPKNLPKLGSALGKTVKNVREGMEGDEDDKKKDKDDAEEVVEDDDDADVEDVKPSK